MREDIWKTEPQTQWDLEECYRRYKQHIHIQLGRPQELTDEEVGYAVQAALAWRDANVITSEQRVREYAIAMATMILGRIRGKLDTADSKALLRDARFRFVSLGCGPYGGPRWVLSEREVEMFSVWLDRKTKKEDEDHGLNTLRGEAARLGYSLIKRGSA